MEFTEQFAAIQGALISIQKREGLLKELSIHEPDDAPKILRVILLLKDIVCPENTETEEEIDKLRKFNLFLILNTELAVKECLIDDINCGHLVDCAPTLSKDLLLEIVWELSLQKYMAETILFCPPFLSAELLDMVIKKIKTLSVSSAISWYVEFTKAVYSKLVMLQFHEDDDDDDDEDEIAVDYMKSKLFAYYKTLLQCLANPSSLKLGSMTKMHMYEQAGILIKNIILLVNACLVYYTNYTAHSSSFVEIYNIRVNFDYWDWVSCEELNGKDLLTTLNDELFQICMNNLSCVTCDLWMYFAECDSECGNERSLQNDIAEAMYACLENIKVVQKMGNESLFLKDLIPILESMAVKPRDEDDEIKEADLNVVLQNIANKDKSQKKWFKALFKFDNLFVNKNCVECIENYLHFVDYEEVDIILRRTISQLVNVENSDSFENLKYIALDALKSVPIRSQLEIMNICLTKCSINPILLTKNFHAEITEVFNKAVNISEKMEDKFYSDFIRLSMQNPKEVVKKLILEALTNSQQCSLMVDILKELWPLKAMTVQQLSDGTVLPLGADGLEEDASSWSLVTSTLYHVMVVHEWTDSERENCVQLIAALVNESIINGDEFMNLCLLPTLHSRLMVEDWPLVELWLEILQVYLDGRIKEKSSLNQAVLLMVLAQIIELSQKSLFTFSAKSMPVCEQALSLVEIVLDAFLAQSVTQDRGVKWLQQELVTLLSPKNLLYFGKLWYNFGTEPPPELDCQMMLVHCTSLRQNSKKWPKEEINIGNERLQFLGALVKVLPSGTSKEWKAIAQNLKHLIRHSSAKKTATFFLFDLFADAILLLSLSASTETDLTEAERECAVSCLDYCIRNFGMVMKEEILKESQMPLSATTGTSMFRKCIHVNERLPVAVKESCSGMVMNILVDLIASTMNGLQSDSELQKYRLVDSEIMEKVVLKESVVKNLSISIAEIQNTETRQVLARKVLEVIEVK